jgi:hypothetical protein
MVHAEPDQELAMGRCSKMMQGHGIPNGTMCFRILGAYNAPCQIWYIGKNDFGVFYDGIVIVVRHHDSFALRQALSSPYFLQATYLPKHQVIRVWIAQEHIPLRFYMTSGVLKPCDNLKVR